MKKEKKRKEKEKEKIIEDANKLPKEQDGYKGILNTVRDTTRQVADIADIFSPKNNLSSLVNKYVSDKPDDNLLKDNLSNIIEEQNKIITTPIKNIN